ncbi:MAG TPA: siderophore-interacting protein [Pseudonocardiaceae bacterium]
MQPLPVRLVHVTAVARPTPRTARVTFTTGDAPASGVDQQVKLYFPRAGQSAPVLPPADQDFLSWYQAYGALPDDVRPPMRSYTLRAVRPDSFDIDFHLHAGDPGPATSWALSAAVGDTLGMFGPAAYFARPVPLADTLAASRVLLIGDETAVPAIETILPAVPAGVPATAHLLVHDAAEERPLPGHATVRWHHRAAGATLGGLAPALTAEVRPGLFTWLAGEAPEVRVLRRHLLAAGADRRAVDFTGYWRPTLSQDDAPTADDLADAQELLAQA